MSRSIIKNFFRGCGCCNRPKDNKQHRINDKRSLNKLDFDSLSTGHKSHFKKNKDFRVRKRKRDSVEESKWMAERHSKTKKERVALEAKYRHRLISK